MDKQADYRSYGGTFSRVRMGACERCPRGKTQSEKLSELGRSVVPHCMGLGPSKNVLTEASVRVDYISGTVQINPHEEDVCPADLVERWQEYEVWHRSRMYDAYELAMDVVLGLRPNFAGEALRSVEHPLINEPTPSGVLRSQPEDSRIEPPGPTYFLYFSPDLEIEE